jgi:hypothetical protein
VNNRPIRFVERERSAEDPDRVRDRSAEDRETARVWALAAAVPPDAETALVVLVVSASSTFHGCTIDTANMNDRLSRLDRPTPFAATRLALGLHDAAIANSRFGRYLVKSLEHSWIEQSGLALSHSVS